MVGGVRRPLGYAALAAVLLAPMAVLLARAPGLTGQRPVLESGAGRRHAERRARPLVVARLPRQVRKRPRQLRRHEPRPPRV
jgi:hypothetical protein